MTGDRHKTITGFIGSAILAVFILGLAHSISTGCSAGRWAFRRSNTCS